MNYYEKYIKYKIKYLELTGKNSMHVGGGVALISHSDRINFFSDEHMAQYLNPIYGLILYKSGFITNTLHLHNSEFIRTPESVLIKKGCHISGNSVKPTSTILNLKSRDFGRYIAIKYINMENTIIDRTSAKNKIIFIKDIQNNIVVANKLNEYIAKLNSFIPLVHNNQFYFHIILFYMWWTANNDEGIMQYYQGINDVFDMIKQCTKCSQYEQINTIDPPHKNNIFESMLVDITKENFVIYDQEQSVNFCGTSLKQTYYDCGEVTARNLINLLCFNGEKFDIDILQQFRPIPELIRYYENFSTFQLQSMVGKLSDTMLNARDEWSKLIIFNANHNINFRQLCNDRGRFGYELNSGLGIDNITDNFLQLIRNLLGITRWDDLATARIKEINDNTTKGIGTLNIIHEEFGEFEIRCEDGHYEMNAINQKSKEISYDGMNEEQINIIDKLLGKNITVSNYEWIKFDSNFLAHTITERISDIEPLTQALLKLSITGQFDSDLRRRVKINIYADYFTEFIDICKDNSKVHNKLTEYTYISRDFEFMKNNPIIAQLNLKIRIDPRVTTIDLSPLTITESINDDFLADCYKLKEINLRYLYGIRTIGDSFLLNCNGLIRIDLRPLHGVNIIGSSFLSGCSALTRIDLRQLSNINRINNSFLTGCTDVKDIKLPVSSKIVSVGDHFLSSCENLTRIDLRSLSSVEQIGNFFLYGCYDLMDIYLPDACRVKSIGNYFVSGCSRLKRISLIAFSGVEAIGSHFLDGCSGLTSIDLYPLSQVKIIGDYFLCDCSKQSRLNLSGGNYVTIGLKTINLSPLTRLETIGNYFLSDCSGITSIDLTPLSQIKHIGSNFLHNCSGLTSIKCSIEQYQLVLNSLSVKHRDLLNKNATD